MPREPFNVLVIPYRERAGAREFAVFHRSDCEMWQFIAGGGEDGEQPAATARREAFEEAGIDGELGWIALDTTTSIPRTAYPDAPWPPSVLVIPEICFAVHVPDVEIRLSPEHDRFEWLDSESARTRLTWDSNRVALWELQQRLRPRELRTERLLLRAMRPEDRAGYAELLADPGTHPFITESGPVPESDIPARIRQNRDSI
ncbi:MAG: NUDIX domain-containing protein, partial [Planctomycetota bacterium]